MEIVMENIRINTEYIKLNQLLKWAGIAETGGEANHLISDGRIKVNGEIEIRKGKKIYSGDIIQIDNDESFLIVN